MSKARAVVYDDASVRALPTPGKKPFYDVATGTPGFKVRRRKGNIFYIARKSDRVEIFGDADSMSFEAARTEALRILENIKEGRPPRAEPQPEKVATTLGMAWEIYNVRTDISPRTMYEHRGFWRRRLKQWADLKLIDLVHSPIMVRKEHERLTETVGAVEANHTMRLLRAIYRFIAKVYDTSLPLDRHPCTGVKFNKERSAQRALAPSEMPKWWRQIAKLRQSTPIHAAFHVLGLYTGMRPGELARAEWKNLDLKRRVLVVTDTKKAPVVEVPLTIPMIQELRRLREVARLAHPNSRFIFPSFSKRGHLVEWKRDRSELSHWGNSGRHTHKTIATDIGVNDLISDLLEGRQLKRAGLAGRGYINRAALHYTALREGQRRISAEITKRLYAA